MIIDRNAVTQEVPIDPETGKPYLNTVAAIQVSANGVGSEVAGEAAKKLAEQGYRTSLVLHMDIRPGFTGQLTEKPKLVDEILADKQAK